MKIRYEMHGGETERDADIYVSEENQKLLETHGLELLIGEVWGYPLLLAVQGSRLIQVVKLYGSMDEWEEGVARIMATMMASGFYDANLLSAGE